jgi:hypothetical protein
MWADKAKQRAYYLRRNALRRAIYAEARGGVVRKVNYPQERKKAWDTAKVGEADPDKCPLCGGSYHDSCIRGSIRPNGANVGSRGKAGLRDL